MRRALAIQLIINREWGLSMNENPLQGSFIVDELTDLVEEAVLAEFDRITERGGVLGAMETGYQRGQDPGRVDALRAPQARRLAADHRRQHLPAPPASGRRGAGRRSNWPAAPRRRSSRSCDRLADFHARHRDETPSGARARCGTRRPTGGNVFAALMDAARVCSLGQITEAFFEVGAGSSM